MITGDIKKQVDRIRDEMWSCRISNPLTVVEPLTYLLFIKRLVELHTRQEKKGQPSGHGHRQARPAGQGGGHARRHSRGRPRRQGRPVRNKLFEPLQQRAFSGQLSLAA